MVAPTTLFLRKAATVRDSGTVLVLREVSHTGTVLYRKRFKAQGFDIWAARENQFFSLFSLKKLQKVVRPETIKNTEHGSVSEVVTFDAGLTIDEWLQLELAEPLANGVSHVFAQGGYLMQLTRACLAALKEIHQIGVIHCDIKPDNICIPWSPRDWQSGQAVTIEFEQIRLIDFSFSLSADIPLEHAVLPLDSRSSYAEYLSPRFREALLADQASGQPQQVKQLDYTVDLYSLAFMLNRLLARGIVWPDEQGEALLRGMIEQWLAHNKQATHDDYLKQLDNWLNKQPPLTPIRLQQQADTTTLASTTPATPLIATPLIAPEATTNTTSHKEVVATRSGTTTLQKIKPYQKPLLIALGAIALIAISWGLKSSGPSIPMVSIPGQSYQLSQYEISQQQWQQVMDNNPSQFNNCPQCPVETVSWNEVQQFIQKLNQQSGKQYRLPSSAEWEFACYGGQETRYCGGDDIDEIAWHQDNSSGKPQAAGQKKANAFGLYDMSGNVAEWVQDCVDESCRDHIARGGSWISEASRSKKSRGKSDELRARTAIGIPSDAKGNNLGFRLALDSPQ